MVEEPSKESKTVTQMRVLEEKIGKLLIGKYFLPGPIQVRTV